MNKDEFLKLSCKHEEAYTRTAYEGDKLVSAVTYCRECQNGFVHEIAAMDSTDAKAVRFEAAQPEGEGE